MVVVEAEEERFARFPLDGRASGAGASALPVAPPAVLAFVPPLSSSAAVGMSSDSSKFMSLSSEAPLESLSAAVAPFLGLPDPEVFLLEPAVVVLVAVPRLLFDLVRELDLAVGVLVSPLGASATAVLMCVDKKRREGGRVE